MKNPSELTVPSGDGRRHHGARLPGADASPRSARRSILGHGAGAGQRSTFMVDFARALSGARRRRRHLQLSSTPNRAGGFRIAPPVLEACYRAVIDAVRAQLASARRALVHRRQVDGRANRHAGRGGRSGAAGRGSRAARLSAAPAGTPTERRDKHLPAVGRPMLFVQGSRDAFGTPAELAPIVERAAARGDAPRRGAAAIIRSSCRARIRRRRPRCTPRFSARHRGLDTFSSMTSPPCENPWRDTASRSAPTATARRDRRRSICAHFERRFEQARADAAARGRLHVEIRDVGVGFRARRPDWAPCAGC